MPSGLMKCFVRGLLFVLAGWQSTALGAETVRFGRDVLPILSTNCFACHGPDESVRKADLRLDLEADAKAAHGSGTPVIPGNPAESTLIQRIMSPDPDIVMPPPDSHRTLTAEQTEILQQWISEGAIWGRHWSFEPVERPQVAVTEGESPIDILVSRELARHGLTLRPSANPRQLIRRASLDLIGLPPTLEAADAFSAAYESAADQAAREMVYERMLDELLASPRFGEHWARLWMDLARYADTKGYEKDLGRTMWPWRDWLVNAINADQPLDQMTIELLAGDMLPEPATSQLVATAFHRNTMSNDEGGTDDEEFRTIAVKDRVDTTLQVWMGLTAGCAKCHSHKYDPISQHEYYSLYAIFNQTQDADRYDDSPTLEILQPSEEASRHRLHEKIASLETQLQAAEAAATKLEENRWQFSVVEETASDGDASLKVRSDSAIVVSGTSASEDVYQITLKLKAGRHTVLRLEALPEKFSNGQLGVGRNPRDPNFVLSELEVQLLANPENKRLALTNPKADFSQEGWPVSAALDGDTKTGWAVSPRQRERHVALFTLAEPLQLDEDASLKVTLRQHYGDSLTLQCFRLSTTEEDPALVELPQPSREQRRLIDELAAAKSELQELMKNVARLPVMKTVATENQRTSKIHRRGNFLDPGDEVTAGLPAAFHGQSETGSPVNRLVLAQWLMSRDNPLTSRVWANRIWARLFGVGIVETEEDFGTLGATPSHPELLDWLATEYRDQGWSLKRFLKTVLMSRMWRQDSGVTAELRERDPQNRLFSRGARFRLSAETVRDQALAVSSLLSDKMGGPPVMPPQPDGLWRSTYNGQKWINAEGEDRFRRALYTYLKRTTPYPSMTTFDGGSGEVCQIRRIRTNTPLQALVTLNDPVYLEAAGAFAKRMTALSGDAMEKTAFGLRLALIRTLRDGETRPLERLQQEAQQSLTGDPEKAESLILSARATVPEGMSDAEFASWIVVANTILNLDEFLTRN